MVSSADANVRTILQWLKVVKGKMAQRLSVPTLPYIAPAAWKGKYASLTSREKR